MNFRDFLTLAATLAAGSTEAEWRSAVSRAYYAAFHVGCELLRDLAFRVPRADRAHAYVWLRLANSSDPDVQNAGQDLNNLRGERNTADYNAYRTLGSVAATQHVQTTEEIIRVLDAAAHDPTRTQMTDAMKVYERDVLKDVTWHP